MNQAKRYVARQLLQAVGTHMRVDHHELYRLAKASESEGLTEKERAFMLKTIEEHDRVCERVSKLGQHLQRTL